MGMQQQLWRAPLAAGAPRMHASADDQQVPGLHHEDNEYHLPLRTINLHGGLLQQCMETCIQSWLDMARAHALLIWRGFGGSRIAVVQSTGYIKEQGTFCASSLLRGVET